MSCPRAASAIADEGSEEGVLLRTRDFSSGASSGTADVFVVVDPKDDVLSFFVSLQAWFFESKMEELISDQRKETMVSRGVKL